MPRTHIYVSYGSGSDGASGLLPTEPVRTLAAAALIAASAVGSGATSLTLHIMGHQRIDAGGDPADNRYAPGVEFSDHRIEWAAESSYGYSSRFTAAGGYETFACDAPKGVSVVDAVVVDGEGAAARLDGVGREMTDLELGADAAAVMSTSGLYFWSKGVLHINPGGVTGSVEVIWRQPANFSAFALKGGGFDIVDLAGSCLLYQPMFVSSTAGVASYMFEFEPTAAHHSGYTIAGFKARTSWHLAGWLRKDSGLAISDCVVRDMRIRPRVKSDYASISCNPFVLFTSASPGSPAVLALDGIRFEGVRLEAYRPVSLNGNVMPGGAGGTVGNNNVQLVYSHGGNANVSVQITQSESVNNHCDLWDYGLSDPYFAQSTSQAIAYTPFDRSVWGSICRNLTVRSRLPYNSAYAGSGFGRVGFAADRNIFIEALTWKAPDGGVAGSGAGSVLGMMLTCMGGGTLYCDLLFPKIMIAGNNLTPGRYVRFWQLAQVGGSGAAAVQVRTLNMTFVEEAASNTEQLVWWDATGSVLATVENHNAIHHTNASGNFTLMYDFDATQLPLDQTRCIFQNCWYSGVAAWDSSAAGTTRNTELKWRTDAGGPLDGKITDGAGNRDAQYDSAGVWDPAVEDWAPGSPALTRTISSAVTLSYTGAYGVDGAAWSRNFGAQQRGVGSARPGAPVLISIGDNGADDITAAWSQGAGVTPAFYRLYWRTAGYGFNGSDCAVVELLSIPHVENFKATYGDGPWFFAVTAVGPTGLESAYSNEVTYV